jgi:hypothetical protein
VAKTRIYAKIKYKHYTVIMNIRYKHSKKKSLYILAALVLLGLAGFLAYSYLLNNENKSDTGGIHVTPAPAILSSDDATAKQHYIENQAKQSTSSSNHGTNKESVKVEVAAKQDAKTVTVTTQIYSIGDGNCTLTVSNGAKSYSQTAQVLYQATYSTCAGFSVPVEKLGAGMWDIKVDAKSLDSLQASGSTTLGVKS